MKNIQSNQKGVILVLSLLVVLITVTLSVVYVARAVNEKRRADQELRGMKSLYAAEAGGQAGLQMLDTLINTYLLNTVNATNPTTISNSATGYVGSTNPNSTGFLISYVRNGGAAQLTASGSGATAEAVYTGTSVAIDGGTYNYTIRIAQKKPAESTIPNVWDLFYAYRIQTTGTYGATQSKKFTVSGDFSVRVQKDNFARYALFTNNQTLPNGTPIWFNNSTTFSGPLFTNGRFNFANNPSGVFYDNIKQEDSQAKFYNLGTNVNLDADSNGAIDVPTFHNGFERSATGISMPTTTVESSMVSEATGGNTYGSNGIYLPNSSGALTGGIYVKGDANSVTLAVNGSNQAVYTVVQGATTKTITVDHTNNQTTVQSGATTTTYTGVPDGSSNVGTILYVSGNINSLGGTVQEDTQMIIATHNDVVIQNNIRYDDYTPGSGTPGTVGYIPPSASGTTNLLGVMSWAGNVRIGTSAPTNLEIHGTLMAQQGIVTVDNYDTTAVRGKVTVLGGVISNYYGAFGTFNGSTGVYLSGYGRNFVYDDRLDTQYTPPYFPTINTFIAFTNDINDKKFWQQGGF